MYEFFDIINNKSGASVVTRYLRLNEGTTDGYETSARLIPDPLAHFDVEINLLGSVDTSGMFFAQNLSSNIALSELRVFQNNGPVDVVIGGSTTNMLTTLTAPGVWRFKFDGVDIELFKNGVSVETITAQGAMSASEPAATFTMCMRHNGTQGSYSFHYAGVMADVVVRNSSGIPVNGYFINDNGNTLIDNVGSDNAAIVNPDPDDWGLFKEFPTLWKGQSLTVPPWASVDQELLK